MEDTEEGGIYRTVGEKVSLTFFIKTCGVTDGGECRSVRDLGRLVSRINKDPTQVKKD